MTNIGIRRDDDGRTEIEIDGTVAVTVNGDRIAVERDGTEVAAVPRDDPETDDGGRHLTALRVDRYNETFQMFQTWWYAVLEATTDDGEPVLLFASVTRHPNGGMNESVEPDVAVATFSDFVDSLSEWGKAGYDTWLTLNDEALTARSTVERETLARLGELGEPQVTLPDQPDDLPERLPTGDRGRPRNTGPARRVDGGINGSPLPALAGDDGLLAGNDGDTPTERLRDAIGD